MSEYINCCEKCNGLLEYHDGIYDKTGGITIYHCVKCNKYYKEDEYELDGKPVVDFFEIPDAEVIE
jgi:hypothetical protein